jgi:cell division protein FtsL
VRAATRRKTRPGVLVRTLRTLELRRLAILLTGLIALALVKVWIGQQVVATGYQLSDLRHERQRLEEYRQQLQVELATQQSRAALEDRARRTLGLTTPARGQVVDIR